MSDSPSPRRRASAISGLLVLLSLLILVRGAPIVVAYTARFRATHSHGATAASVTALLAIFCLLFVGIWKWPRATAAAGALASLLLVTTSGNGAALLIAATLLGLTLLTGDWASRLFRGREAEEGELAISIAAGSVTLGASFLLLGEAGLAKPFLLMAIALLLGLARWRRIPQLWRLTRGAVRAIVDTPHSPVEALWLAIFVAAVAAGFLGALRPDVSFDALAYHLPEIRQFADQGRVEPLVNIPQTFLWHNYETFLGVGFLAGGERVVSLLHFFVGLAAFGSAVALSRRLGRHGSGALVLLALAALPAVCAQLKQTYVDLPAALFLTAAAVEIAASDREPRRLWLAGFLFGGAVATKIFALLGAVALLILMSRRHRGSLRPLLAFTLCAAIPLVPWFAWSQSRSGFFLSPYSDPWLKKWSHPVKETYIPPRPSAEMAPAGVAGFFRLPYDRTFRPFRFVSTGDSFTGFLPLLLLLGVAGWGGRRFALFWIAAAAALLPWYLLASARVLSPSIRFLVPLYPLYAVFAVLGLKRLTEDFRGGLGAAAAVSLAVLSMAFPAQLFSAPLDAKIALGRVSREQALSTYLPAYPLMKHLRPEDRVLLLGDSDRYHCPASYVLRDRDVNLPSISEAPDRWRNELRRLRITRIVYRSDQLDRTLLDSLGDCIEIVDQYTTDRYGTATLYRVNWERASCSPSVGPDSEALGGSRGC